MEPKVCRECRWVDSYYCDGEPCLCALGKARTVRRARAEARRTGESEEAVLARYEDAEEAAILKDMADFVAFAREEGQ